MNNLAAKATENKEWICLPKGKTVSAWLGKNLVKRLHHYSLEHRMSKGKVVRLALQRLFDEADNSWVD